MQVRAAVQDWAAVPTAAKVAIDPRVERVGCRTDADRNVSTDRDVSPDRNVRALA